MPADRQPSDPRGANDAPTIVVPDVRDYSKINAELIAQLDAGHALVRLTGVDGQRLLVQGLRGNWSARVIVEGNAGPELAADLNAPNLTVVCTGSAKDGAGRSLRAGTLIVEGDANVAVGYAQPGGTILVKGSVGPRAGLDQSGGTLIVSGAIGRLAGERQSGGQLMIQRGPVGPFLGHGRRGGRVVLPGNWTLEDEQLLAKLVTATPLA